MNKLRAAWLRQLVTYVQAMIEITPVTAPTATTWSPPMSGSPRLLWAWSKRPESRYRRRFRFVAVSLIPTRTRGYEDRAIYRLLARRHIELDDRGLDRGLHRSRLPHDPRWPVSERWRWLCIHLGGRLLVLATWVWLIRRHHA